MIAALRSLAESIAKRHPSEPVTWDSSIRIPTKLALRDRGLVTLEFSEVYACYGTRSGSSRRMGGTAARVYYNHEVGVTSITDAGRAVLLALGDKR